MKRRRRQEHAGVEIKEWINLNFLTCLFCSNELGKGIGIRDVEITRQGNTYLGQECGERRKLKHDGLPQVNKSEEPFPLFPRKDMIAVRIYCGELWQITVVCGNC